MFSEKDFNNGIYLEDYNILIKWEITKNEFIKELSHINYEINVQDKFNYCGVRIHSSVFGLKETYLLCFNFLKDKLTSINISKQIMHDIENSFVITQKKLTEILGKSKIVLPQTVFHSLNKKYIWDFRKIKIVHELFERMGIQETLTIYIK